MKTSVSLFASAVSLLVASALPVTAGSQVPPPALTLLRVPPNWEVASRDDTPTVRVGQCRGYRICLREIKSSGFSDLQGPEPLKEGSCFNHSVPTGIGTAEVVVFPGESELPKNAASLIRWSKSKQEWLSKAAYWGEGSGMRWFGNTSLFWQFDLRKAMGLEGGDDPIKLLVQGLHVTGKDQRTYCGSMHRLIAIGQPAVPYLVARIDREFKADPEWEVSQWDLPEVWVLTSVAGKSSDETVRTLYKSANPMVARAAADALLFGPHRAGAKDLYLDMLKRYFPGSAAKVCAEFNWQEALPLVKRAAEKPGSWYDFRDLFEARRRLEGKPLSEELVTVEKTLLEVIGAHGWEERDRKNAEDEAAKRVDKCKDAIVASPDREGAIVVATTLALRWPGKCVDPEIPKIGKSILKRLPDSRAFLRSVWSSMRPNTQKDELGALLKTL
jgi:hypothetical protein